jgi:hypothetical protein
MNDEFEHKLRELSYEDKSDTAATAQRQRE